MMCWRNLPLINNVGVFLQNRICRENVAFHERKVIANANTRTSSEGQIRGARQSLLAFRCEALRIKHLRVWEVFRAPVQSVRGKHQIHESLKRWRTRRTGPCFQKSSMPNWRVAQM